MSSENNQLLEIFKNIIVSPEPYWSRMLRIQNPYVDPWPENIKKGVPEFDHEAFIKYENHNFVYDKLWIAESQGLQCGKIEKLIKHPQKHLDYPIFIKPRWGHKSASSKNCFKIESHDELKKYGYLDNVIWTEFINETEGMTDFLMYKGKIVYYITYEYSKSQNGVVADEWKYICNENKPPSKIVHWVNTHMKNFSGICNAQYRGDKIIEISLRLGRGGAYLYCTGNPKLIKCVNELVIDNKWDYSNFDNIKNFKPFYSFKCFTNMPLIYIPPHYILERIVVNNNCKKFYEYYFEPSGKKGMAFFQFFNEDFDTGMKIKKQIENIVNFSNYFFYLMILLICILLLVNRSLGQKIAIIIVILYLTRYLNSSYTVIGLMNAQKQQLFG